MKFIFSDKILSTFKSGLIEIDPKKKVKIRKKNVSRLKKIMEDAEAYKGNDQVYMKSVAYSIIAATIYTYGDGVQDKNTDAEMLELCPPAMLFIRQITLSDILSIFGVDDVCFSEHGEIYKDCVKYLERQHGEYPIGENEVNFLSLFPNQYVQNFISKCMDIFKSKDAETAEYMAQNIQGILGIVKAMYVDSKIPAFKLSPDMERDFKAGAYSTNMSDKLSLREKNIKNLNDVTEVVMNLPRGAQYLPEHLSPFIVASICTFGDGLSTDDKLSDVTFIYLSQHIYVSVGYLTIREFSELFAFEESVPALFGECTKEHIKVMKYIVSKDDDMVIGDDAAIVLSLYPNTHVQNFMSRAYISSDTVNELKELVLSSEKEYKEYMKTMC